MAGVATGVLGTIATYAAIAAAAASIASIGYSASQGAPKLPNAASASREIAQAQAEGLASQRALAAAEQQGGKFSQFIPKHTEQQQFVRIPTGTNSIVENTFKGEGKNTTLGSTAAVMTGGISGLFGVGDEQTYRYVPYKAEEWQAGGKYNPDGKYDQKFLDKNLVKRGVKVGGKTQENDFAGYGTADIEGKLATQMADVQERLSKKYGVPFAEEATKEARLADPMGFAARDKELELIQNQIDNPPPVNPLSKSLDDRMKSRLDAGSGLDPMSKELLDKAVAKANASRGGQTAAGDVENSMSTGMQGAARRQAGIGQAQSWLTSGSTPEDIAYRREQQNKANLGSFVAGQTPESQFHDLSGAGQGATPFYPGQPAPTMPNNAGQVGQAGSVAAWQQSLRNQSGQANGWLAGISSVLNGIGTVAITK